MTDSCDLYRVLGLSKDASQDDIRSAFKKLALQHHPDKKAGDDSEFKKINEAYQILSDVDKRRVYDMKYEDNVNIDLISKLASILMNIVHDKLKEKVSNQRQQHTNNSNQKANPIRLNISVDVEDIYNAKVKKIVVKVKRRETPDSSFVFKSKTLYISLLNYRDEYVFEGQGDDNDGGARGDIIVKLDVKSETNGSISVDTLFCKYDLHMECKMTLYQYLYGFDVKLPYFNDDVIHVAAQPSKRDYLQDDGYYNYVHELESRGLPYIDGEQGDNDENNIKRGKLFIYFKLFLDSVPEDKLIENEIFFRTYFNGTKASD